jgi:hypothetical protein
MQEVKNMKPKEKIPFMVGKISTGGNGIFKKNK